MSTFSALTGSSMFSNTSGPCSIPQSTRIFFWQTSRRKQLPVTSCVAPRKISFIPITPFTMISFFEMYHNTLFRILAMGFSRPKKPKKSPELLLGKFRRLLFCRNGFTLYISGSRRIEGLFPLLPVPESGTGFERQAGLPSSPPWPAPARSNTVCPL